MEVAQGNARSVQALERAFRSVVSAWRQQAMNLDSLLASCEDPKVLNDVLKELQNQYTEVVKSYKEACDLMMVEGVATNHIDGSFERTEMNAVELSRRTSLRIQDIKAEMACSKSRASGAASHTRGESRVGSSKHGSVSGHTSESDCRSVRKLSVATQAARLKSKLRHADLEAKTRVELEAKKTELEKVQLMAELSAAEAELEVINEVGTESFVTIDELPASSSEERVKDFLKSIPTSNPSRTYQDFPSGEQSSVNHCAPRPQSTHRSPQNVRKFAPSGSHKDVSTYEQTPRDCYSPSRSYGCPVLDQRLDPAAPEFIYNQVKQEEGQKSATPFAVADSTSPHEDVIKLIGTVAGQLGLNRLPVPEPGVFTGDPMAYNGWAAAFETLIESKSIPAAEKMHYLSRYIGGAAKQAVEGYVVLTTDEAFEDAKALLKKRFGSPFIIAEAFRSKLEKWPEVESNLDLRKLSDFLRQCQSAMKTNTHLGILNDELENKKILKILPNWMIRAWGRKVATHRSENDENYPPFSAFVKYVAQEADLVNDPVTSVQSLKGTKRKEKGKDDKKAVDSGKAVGARTLHNTAEKVSPTDKKKCLLCDKGHDLNVCYKFLAKSLEERRTFVKEKNLCYGCLTTGHRSKFCKARLKCKTCAKNHPTSLHEASVKVDTKEEPQKKDDPKPQNSTSHRTVVEGGASLSSMVVPVWISHADKPGEERLIYALLDSQSDVTFILQQTCDALGIQGDPAKLQLSTMLAEKRLINSQKVSGLVVRGYNSTENLLIPTAYSRDIMPVNREHIPTPEMARQWTHLHRIAPELIPLNSCEVGLLIGYNNARALAPREVITGTKDEPYAIRTDLGWSVVGVVDHNSVATEDVYGNSHKVVSFDATSDKVNIVLKTQSVREVINPSDLRSLMEGDLGGKESDAGVKNSQEDKRFLEILEKGIHKDNEGHYEMPLPLKNPDVSLPDNKIQALSRAKQLKSRLMKDAKYYQQYKEFMDGLLEKDYASKVPEQLENSEVKKKGQVWYLPHFGVYHPQKKESIRVVFDCSVRYKDISLNDCLLQGPDMTNSLLGVLLRFREESVALQCDVQKMFLQFRVNPEHRDMLRFLWWEDGNLELEPSVFRMNVHLFGATSSPGCANFALRHLADEHEPEYGPEVKKFVQRHFYVDDGLKSTKSEDEAISLFKNAQALCSQGGLKLHKVVSNSPKVMQAVSPHDLATGVKDIDLSRMESKTTHIERALGVVWCIENDTFQFRINLQDKPLTRRGILSTVGSVYDPLGMAAPFVLVGKQILQKLCGEGMSWDEPLPDNIRHQWQSWRTDLMELDSLMMPRCFKPEGFGEPTVTELHHFSDASTGGLGQSSYLRLVNEKGEVHCSFVMGKARVAPSKVTTIPRLELAAAVMSVKASTMISREIDYKIGEEVFWTDSKIVLGYIQNEAKRFSVFVGNRVQVIKDQSTTEQWRHVSSEQNPADEGSRGCSVKKLTSGTSMWLTGPAFLWKSELPTREQPPSLDPEDPEIKKTTVLDTRAKDVTLSSINLEKFSSWTKLKRVIALCLEFIRRLRNKRAERMSFEDCLDVELMDRSEKAIIRMVQGTDFRDEIEVLRQDQTKVNGKKQSVRIKRTSPLYRLDPFVDEDGILRIGGRLKRSALDFDVRHPYVISRNSPIAVLLVRHFHEKVAHMGRGTTINKIRDGGFWIVGMRRVVASLIFRCVPCRHLRQKTLTQKMADLPEDRVLPEGPFQFCGTDLFGPWTIREGRKDLKKYGVVFTCLASRAVHIETVNTMNTDSFVNALRRFLAVRGPCRTIRCDQGTNIMGAARELKEAWLSLDHDKIKQFLMTQNVDYKPPAFKPNVPGASEMAGVWERQIRTIRSILSQLLAEHGQQLDDESFRTLMAEVMAIINCRPLAVQDLEDPLSLTPLTPNHILTMKSQVVVPPPGVFQRPDVYLAKRWRRVQYLTDQFWSRWQREYLNNLQSRAKWNEPQRNLQEGDIVMVKEENLPRNAWRLAKVVETYPSEDHRVRKVKVALGDKELDRQGRRAVGKSLTCLDRPVSKLVLILQGVPEPSP